MPPKKQAFASCLWTRQRDHGTAPDNRVLTIAAGMVEIADHEYARSVDGK
jgi:hypothetical protein